MARPDAGDLIVASVVALSALLLTLGLFGIPFVGEIGAIWLFIHGALLRRGSLGAHGTFGILFMILGPAFVLIPPFLPAIGVVIQIATVVGLWILVGTKLAKLW